jgi:hypothetical protein
MIISNRFIVIVRGSSPISGLQSAEARVEEDFFAQIYEEVALKIFETDRKI